MHNVLTLVAPSSPQLSEAILNTIFEEFRQLKINPQLNWLSENEACDLYFSGMDCDAVDKLVRKKINGLSIDLAVQPAENRTKKILIANMDSTIITTESLDEIADFFGLKEEISTITAEAMNGKIPFERALIERVAMLKGFSDKCIAEIIANFSYSKGAKVLVKTMNKNGSLTALVSGGFRQFTNHVRDALGFTLDFGNELEIKEGKFTGRIVGDVLTGSVKKQIMDLLMDQHRLSYSEVLAVGDGANDIPMLLAAGLGVGYRAKSIVAEKVRFNISHAGLEALLFFQGIPRVEFEEE